MENINFIKNFIEEKKSIINGKGNRFDKCWYIVIDNNDVVRYSESIHILTQENLKFRLIGIQESWQNYRGYYNDNSKSFYSIHENGDIHEGFFIDGWELRFSCYYMIKEDFSFSIGQQGDLLSTLNHFWQTFLTIKSCKSQTEIDYFKRAYYATNNVSNFIQDYKNKDHEIVFLKKQIANYEKLVKELSKLLNR